MKKKVKPTSKRRPGRPSSYSESIATRICQRLIEGESMRAICAGSKMPTRTTVATWLATRDDFRAQHAQARELQAENLAEEILEIADDASSDYVQTEDGPRLNSEAVQRSKLRVDARKWLASKMAPKRYGEKQEIEHSGGLKVEHTHMTRDEWKSRISQLGLSVVPEG